MGNADFTLLRDVLELLAAEPERQVAELGAFREAAEQVRDGVVDMFRLNEALEERGILPADVAAGIRDLDARFDAMIDAGPEMFTEEAVRRAAEWREVRRAARRCLGALDSHDRRFGRR